MITKTTNKTSAKIPANLEDIPPMLDRRAANGAETQALLARIAQLEAALANKNTRAVTLKVSEKGAVSAYGMGRFPVTLYAQQWEKLLGMADEIREFIAENKRKLSTKD